jgi:meromycolic acid (3R)-3-hydroxyacyl-[acyl-carrier protein] dehydratase HadB
VRLEDVAVGDTLPERSTLVTREDVRAYAEASGDHNPLHHDETVARAAGFPAIVAHGMYTMGHLASAIVAWVGDEASLAAMRVQFRAPVFVGETIVAGGSVRAVDEASRTATLDVWVRLERDGQTEWPIRKSEAVVRLV